MTSLTRYPQSMNYEVIAHSLPLEGEQTTTRNNVEINRLLTAAVVNRRFCRLLLSNPLAALTGGYRGEAFNLNPGEVKRISAIRATSLRDFALQLLVTLETDNPTEGAYSHERQSTAIFAV
ncbi:MAG: hypothetical protein DYG89_45540 [Caldilinea sp. CFX5]|nr:hypothetical protein [Caldilinea sp. CFX5]